MAAPGFIALRHRFARRALSTGFPQRDARALTRDQPDAT
jgi:hypothetical protein